MNVKVGNGEPQLIRNPSSNSARLTLFSLVITTIYYATSNNHVPVNIEVSSSNTSDTCTILSSVKVNVFFCLLEMLMDL